MWHRLRKYGLLFAATTVLSTISIRAVYAGALEVGPTRVTLVAGHLVGNISVHNSGSDDLVVQLETMAWSQAGGDDVYVPTTDLIATPLVFRLAADATQIVRIGLRNGLPASGEQDYRLYVREVPPDAHLDQGGLRMALRIGIPIFSRAAGTSGGKLSWQARLDGDGALLLDAHNSGGQFQRVLTVAASAPGSKDPVWQAAHFGYVLPGGFYRWRGAPSTPLTAGTPLHLQVKTEDGDLQAQVVVEP